MSNAQAHQVRRPREERHSSDFEQQKGDEVDLSLDRTPEVAPDVVVAQEVLTKDYADLLKFGEEPVTVILESGSDENAPIYQEAWVNGRGAEFMIDGRWFPNYPGLHAGYVPVGIELTIKRKYVEVLLRKRETKITTVHEGTDSAHPVNRVRRAPIHRAPLSVLHDANPKGRAWMAQMMRE